MKILCVIPARMGSSRFPGKPLAPICGMPMIEHVYRRAKTCGMLDDVVVATCDEEIARAARGFGARAVMTSSAHERASDRVAEVARSMDADVYLMIQGDEPMIVPEMIERALKPMAEDRGISCVNLMAPILTEEEFLDRNTIKVLAAANGDAICFSREPIPTRARLPFGSIPAFKQVCVIPFSRAAIEEFSRLPPGPLEAAESIDMLRFLEHNRPVRLVPCDFSSQAVDTPEDLRRVEGMLCMDPLFARYEHRESQR